MRVTPDGSVWSAEKQSQRAAAPNCVPFRFHDTQLGAPRVSLYDETNSRLLSTIPGAAGVPNSTWLRYTAEVGASAARMVMLVLPDTPLGAEAVMMAVPVPTPFT